MPKKKYRVDTDRGSYEVEVEEPEPTQGVVGKDEPDTFWGGAFQSIKKDLGSFLTKPFRMEDLAGMLEPLAHPQTASDFGNLMIPSSGGIMRGMKAPAVAAPARKAVGGRPGEGWPIPQRV